jgi:hypothetical protein
MSEHEEERKAKETSSTKQFPPSSAPHSNSGGPQWLMRIFFLFFSLLPTHATVELLLSRVFGGGCPYTASWLIHADLFNLLHYSVTWTKMEAMSFEVIKAAPYSFQFVNESVYYVVHMSQFEHYHRKKSGYQQSENITAVFSMAAMNLTCFTDPKDYEKLSFHNSSLGLIPFYGGRPPNVSADLKVLSLGQGNSLVRPTSSPLLHWNHRSKQRSKSFKRWPQFVQF